MFRDYLSIDLFLLLMAQTSASVLFLQLRYGSVDGDWELGQWSLNPASWQTGGAFRRLVLDVCSVQGRGKRSPSC